MISLEITGDLNDKEKEELKRWTESSNENLELYDKIRREVGTKTLQKENLAIEKEKYWNQIESLIHKDKKRILVSTLMKYAAIFIIAIIFSGLAYYQFYYKNEKITNVQNVAVTELVPGEQKALLVMSDGSNVNLGKEKNNSIKEKDGSVIKNDDNNLTYNTQESGLNEKQQSKKMLYNTLITPKGGEYSIVLSDGTKVQMNAGSKLKYPITFNRNIREVELEGEAYFEVKHLNDTPFLIKTNDYNIEVLGTSFDVLAYKEDSKVITTLVEGSIKIKDFDNSGNEILVKPNEQVILNKLEKGIHIKEVDVNNYIAWKEGRFVFVRQNLEEILKILSRWYNFQVDYENDELKTIVFTGNMDRYEQLSTALNMIAQTNKVNFIIEENEVKVIKRK